MFIDRSTLCDKFYRSKLGKTSFPEVSSIEESPYRVAQLQSGELTFLTASK